ncbi:MAG: hypothetical protein ACN0LA_12020 [Candidatus Longimicrobiales bacterium M2_2A_002]
MDAHDRGRGDGEIVYRLEVEGRIGPRWRDWFDADSVRTADDRTILEVRVTDQSELYGRLRRIHDLNLRLIAVTRADPGEGPQDPNQERGPEPC